MVGLQPDAEELGRLDREPGLLAELAAERVERVLGFLDESARYVPEPGAGIVAAASEQNAPVPLDERLGAGNRIRPDCVAAPRARRLAALDSEIARAARAVPPAVEEPHRATVSR